MEHLFRIINMLRDRGVAIIYISHKMAEIKALSDESPSCVTVNGSPPTPPTNWR